MTTPHRTTWTPHGSPFPAWADHPTAEAAHRHAMNECQHGQDEDDCMACAACRACQGYCGTCPYQTRIEGRCDA